MNHINCHFKYIHISWDVALLVAAVVLVRETWRLQLFHLRLRVQCCQFDLINLLLGSSLVSNVEASAAQRRGVLSVTFSKDKQCYTCTLINTDMITTMFQTLYNTLQV